MITQTIKLNLIPNSEPVVLHVNQYDEGENRIICKLLNGNAVYIPVDATAIIQGTKPDKKGFSYNADIEGDTVTANLEKQMTAVAGDVRTQIVVTEKSGKTGTFVFILKVQPSALADDVDISETVLPAYIDAAEHAADEAQEWASHAPYISASNNHWMVYDVQQSEWIDTGVSADGGTLTISTDGYIHM